MRRGWKSETSVRVVIPSPPLDLVCKTFHHPHSRLMNHADSPCPVCGAPSPLLDVVDLNKSCEELKGRHLPLSGVPIYYARCESCCFCFSPEMHGWPLEKFEQLIYNEQYVQVDPDYLDFRPRNNAKVLLSMFKEFGAGAGLRHIDYGGGGGLLSAVLREQGWNSASYDPFVNRDVQPEQLGRFDIVTAFEVFEHVPDVDALFAHLRLLRAEHGIVLFSTLLSDDDIAPNRRLGWWYASPRNGHISLFSRKSLEILARRHGFQFGSFSRGFHILFDRMPAWAAQLVRQ